ncbi:amino acid permease 6-like isoform X2 [Durio zibethinus]|uniref:Amino acid permease 6-like isoform X2 n=1 Tax=Durio zibethinus TaxID=66656 RepID=A0A6P5ZNY7_DURZI|nr:amino acid permease 6-like isoform X2 [Durio zibethinus]
MQISVLDQEIQHEICETGLDGDKAGDGEFDDDGKPRRTGTVWTASAHIITAVIGSGVLSLSWAMAQLGWIAGVGTLLLFSCIAYYTSSLLADCYRSSNSNYGKRNYSYMEAVKTNLGGIKYNACGFLQYTFLSGMLVGYTITASISMVAIRKSNCFRKNGHEDPCEFSNNPYMIALGIVEIFVSQIPNFHKLSWLSIIAAIMSFGYAFTGMGLAFAKIISGNGARTTLPGVGVRIDSTVADRVLRMFTAAGNMAFACAYSSILIEIQDTLKSSPPENKEMKKANMIGMFTSTTLYLLCCCLGYAAFGNHAPGNMLTGFVFYEPFWVVDLANVFIVVHLVGAYQVVAQPVFKVVESWISSRWPESSFVTEEYPISISSKRNAHCPKEDQTRNN